VTAPTKGTIKIRGRIASLLEVGTGFHPELTGRENIFLNGTIYGMSRSEILKKLDSIIDFSGVEYHIDTPVKRYSSGMYVRLAFSVAAHLDPEILVVDEVLAVGDIEFQRKCLGKMGNVVKDGRTVLFVSHNMGAVGRLCTKCACLEGGRIVYSGKTDKVISYYTGREFEDIGAEQSWNTAIDDDSTSPLILKNAKICQDRSVSSCIMINRPFSITLLLNVLEDINHFSVAVRVTRSDGIVVIHSNKEIIRINKNETLSATLNLPAYTMNSGNYTVDIMADIPNEKVLIFEERCLRFSVIANSTRMSRYGENAYKGVVGPFIGEWETGFSE
jgi:lipopolysaccharide transport system ATP-binding protein